MKKLLSLVLTVCLWACSGGSLSVFAENPISVKVDGVTQNFQVTPFIEQGRTLVSMEDILNSLGAEYEYDDETKSITIEHNNQTITGTVGAEKLKVNRYSYTLDVPTQSINGIVMVPVRFLAEYLGYDVEWVDASRTVEIEKQNLISTQPRTEAEKAVIARARQLSGFTFTPLKDIPTVIVSQPGVFEAGKEYKGFPYSSTEENDKFLCENVSFETFLSALANPDSVLYTKDMYHSSNASTYYGIVCNGLVRYCLGINQRCNTQRWLDIPGMDVVANKGEYSVEDIKLGDVLHAYGEGSNHVAIITDILRDESGEIVKVEITEAIRSTCITHTFYVKDFYTKWAKYKLCRYRYLDTVPPFDEEQNKILFESGIEKQAPMIAVDYGNKSNYFEGDETVISVFAEGKNTVQVIHDGQIIEEILTSGYTKLVRKFEKGYYTVKLADTEYFTEFCVCKPEITHTVKDGVITINASSQDAESKIINMEFRGTGKTIAGINTMIVLTEEEKESGVIVREIPEGAANYKISFENKYGIWTHSMIGIQ